jgi:hypothetical protein
MPIAAVLAAAEAAAETSKTAFYVGGGLLTAFALVLSVVGLSRASFPGTRTAERGVIGVALVLVAGAMITAVATG